MSVPAPQTRSRTAFSRNIGVAEKDIAEIYIPSVTTITRPSSAISKKFAGSGKAAVISIMNCHSNVPFYKELSNQRFRANDTSVIGFSVGEQKLSDIGTKPLAGHLAA
ncbi:transporter substrate-binding protein [Pelomicrobium methylotrophicum]|uniref:Transporter substrate-binding protein n=1 Tax=Pelomicrobium methylotrophicum TaxID=2602750 RepID=A0A5C7EFP5_9PROT|nr:transporter substrate-binding protein [Pelomicrobium methylotrophicum]TXF11053.1 transporter substrate-binding protein [Pelomicrobium methylotrophicum]